MSSDSSSGSDELGTTEESQTSRPQQELSALLTTVVLVLFTCVGAVIRFVHLEKRQFWGDEIHNFEVANTAFTLKNMLRTWYEAPYVADPPLYYILCFFNISSADSYSHFRLRLLSVVFGVACIPLSYFVARLFSGKLVALGTAFLVSLSAFAVEYSQEYRPYSMLMFTGLVFIHALVLACKDPSRSRYGYLVLAIILLEYTHLFGLLSVVPGYLVYVVFLWREKSLSNRAKGLRAIGAPLFSVISYLPIFGFLLNRAKIHSPTLAADSNFAQEIEGLAQKDPLSTIWNAFLGSRDYVPQLHLQLLAGLVLVFSLVYLWRTLRRGLFTILFWLVCSTMLTYAFYEGLKYHFEPRRNIFQLPVFLFLLSAGSLGLVELARFVSGKNFRVSLRLVGVAAFVFVAAGEVVAYLRYDSFGNRNEAMQADWRGMSEFVRDIRRPGDKVVVPQPHGSNWAELHLRFYFASFGMDPPMRIDASQVAVESIRTSGTAVWCMVGIPLNMSLDFINYLGSKAQWTNFHNGTVAFLPAQVDNGTSMSYELVNSRRRQAAIGFTRYPFPKQFSVRGSYAADAISTTVVGPVDLRRGVYRVEWSETITSPPVLMPVLTAGTLVPAIDISSISLQGNALEFPLVGDRVYLRTRYNGTLKYAFYSQLSDPSIWSITAVHDKPGPINVRAWFAGSKELPTFTFSKANNAWGTSVSLVHSKIGPSEATLYYTGFRRVDDPTLPEADRVSSFDFLSWRVRPLPRDVVKH